MRICWIDNAKAIGIILVLFGHTQGIDLMVKKIIYSFHLPLFFFLSGYVLKEKYLLVGYKEYLVKNFRAIIIPYLSFWVLSYLYWIVHGIFQKQFNLYAISTLLKPFQGLLYGTGESLNNNNVLWYFTCWFCTVNFFFWVYRLNNVLKISLLVILGALGPLLPGLIGFRLPWNMEVACTGLVFFAAGHFFSTADYAKLSLNRLRPWLLVLFLALAQTLSITQNTTVNLNTMQFGNLFYYYLGAFSGIFLAIVLSLQIPQNKPMDWISRNTIVLFPLHIILFSVFTGIGVLLLNFPPDFNEKSTISCFVYTFCAIIACIPISYLIRNLTPWMIGIKQSEAGQPGKFSSGSSAIPGSDKVQ